ncbi:MULTISPECIES: hypothetical protein [unclassified Acinetobacter]|uniref:hypothetical protein n=1 Tax=unclassified Acinetobacter TaxID=196816 RepID=UPI000A32DFE5|nr:hypothetical protein [Acinetobacter sp. ANC 4218]OTG70080.1 hypothetical protein B9T38_13760 [Acinetobacter sp. ANC 4218]
MNDFFLATNRSIAVNDIEVRQIQMKDFDTWATHAEPIKQFLKDKNHSDEVLTELFAAHGVQVISAITCVTDLDNESLFKLASDEQRFKELLNAVLIVNQAYFKYEKPKRGAKKAQADESTWFDSFQFMVSMGHQHSEIMEMTYGAFEQYLKSAQKNQRSQLQYLSSVIRSAHHANAKEFKKFFEELRE